MPELYKSPQLNTEAFYASYVSTFVQRDVRQLTAVQNLRLFNRFITVLAARTSQELNYAAIAQEVEVDQKTIKSWIGVLEASGMVYIIPTFSNNHLKRVTKAPVLYFLIPGWRRIWADGRLRKYCNTAHIQVLFWKTTASPKLLNLTAIKEL